MLVLADNPESLSESDLKVIFVQVNFEIVALLPDGAKASTPDSVEIGLDLNYSGRISWESNPDLR